MSKFLTYPGSWEAVRLGVGNIQGLDMRAVQVNGVEIRTGAGRAKGVVGSVVSSR